MSGSNSRRIALPTRVASPYAPRMPSPPELKPWTVSDSKYLIEDRWLSMRADTCHTSSGVVVEPFYVMEVPNWVHIVALDEEGRLLVTRQYRHGSRPIHSEIPCGVIEADDPSPLDAAKRELLEETGCTAERFEALPTVFANPARQDNRIYTFLAHGARVVAEQANDDTEEIQFEFLPVDEVLAAIDRGEFSHSLLVSSVLTAMRRVG